MRSAHVARDVGLGALVALALFVSGFLVILTPLPFIYLFLSRSRGTAFAAAFVSLSVAVLVYLFFSMGQGAIVSKGFEAALPGVMLGAFLPSAVVKIVGIGYFLFFIVVGFSLAEGAVRKWGLLKLGGISLALGLGVIFIIVCGAALYDSVNLVSGVRAFLAQTLSQIVSMNETQGVSTSMDVVFLANNADGIAKFMLGISPSLVFVLALVAVVVNLLIGRRFIRTGHAFSHLHNVARFRMPDFVIWAVIISGMVFFAEKYVFQSLSLEMTSINLLIGLAALYFFQGLAVVVYYLQGIRVPLIKTLAYVMLIFFFQTIGMAIIGVGVADVWVDFRRKNWRSKHSELQS